MPSLREKQHGWRRATPTRGALLLSVVPRRDTAEMAKPVQSAARLDEIAEAHLGYELQMFVRGAITFATKYPKRVPQKFGDPVIDDALLEATLVHARLLDEFLSGMNRADNVKAECWVSGSTGFLDAERNPVNWQVAHMSSNRGRLAAVELPVLRIVWW